MAFPGNAHINTQTHNETQNLTFTQKSDERHKKHKI